MSLVLAGCSRMERDTFSGTLDRMLGVGGELMNPILKQDIAEVAFRIINTEGKCPAQLTLRDIVKQESLGINPRTNVAVEEWTIRGCGKHFYLKVVMMPHPVIGTSFAVWLNKDDKK